MRTKRLSAWLLTVVTGVMLSFAARAENTEFVFYDEVSGQRRTGVCTAYETLTADMTAWGGGNWYVADGKTVIVGRVTVSGNAYLILKDGCELRINGGIGVGKGSHLNIFSESDAEEYGLGQLFADAENTRYQAGIGGTDGNCGDITIHGGSVTATGSKGDTNYGYESGSAGIGGSGENGADCGNITINGGVITATGGYRAAGIGCSGKNNGGGNITIRGGTVTATGNAASGIGSGEKYWYGDITIHGGSLTASGMRGGLVGEGNRFGRLNIAEDLLLYRTEDDELIERGEGQDWNAVLGGRDISFYTEKGGTTAADDENFGSTDVDYLAYDTAAGKFVEARHEGCTVLTEDMKELSGGWYVVWGTLHFADVVHIGGNVRLILTDGCKLEAPAFDATGAECFCIYAQSDGKRKGKLLATGGAEGCAGICGRGTTVDIHGGRLDVRGGTYGAGIGGSEHGNGGYVHIYGGYVKAVGGYNGAGIGGGAGGGAGYVDIYGGEVFATGMHYGASIGRGGEADSFTPVGSHTIHGDLVVVDLGKKRRIDPADARYVSSVHIYAPAAKPEPAPVVYTRRDEKGESAKQECGKYYTPYKECNIWGDGWYVVDGERTLYGVTVIGDAKLILSDGCQLTAVGGIRVSAGNSLTIYGGENGTGSLKADGYPDSAGIGGFTDNGGGDIDIHGGVIEANGGDDGGAGIGGGYYFVGCDYDPLDRTYDLYDSGAAGNIRIYGGNITANGGYCAAGIGGGYGCHGGNVTVYGGYVTANGGYLPYEAYKDNADGIGNGWFDVLDEDDQTVLMCDEVTGGKANILGGVITDNGVRSHTVHSFAGAYTDNHDGTHTRSCLYCDETETQTHKCNAKNVCACGAKRYEVDENGVMILYNGDNPFVDIPEGVTGIAAGTFRAFPAIKDVTLPSSLTSIEKGAFDGTSPKTLTVKWTKEGDIPRFDGDVFSDGFCQGCLLCVPKDTKKMYLSDAFFGRFSHVREPLYNHSLDLLFDGGVYTVKLYGVPEGTVIIAVSGADGRLKDVKLFDIAKGEEPTGRLTETGTVKAFWVKDTESFEPYCGSTQLTAERLPYTVRYLEEDTEEALAPPETVTGWFVGGELKSSAEEKTFEHYTRLPQDVWTTDRETGERVLTIHYRYDGEEGVFYYTVYYNRTGVSDRLPAKRVKRVAPWTWVTEYPIELEGWHATSSEQSFYLIDEGKVVVFLYERN